jgi:hypothetical protein
MMDWYNLWWFYYETNETEVVGSLITDEPLKQLFLVSQFYNNIDGVFKCLFLKYGSFDDIIINQWVEILNIDLRICSNTHFAWAETDPPAVWARGTLHNLFITYVLAVVSSNHSLVHGLIVLQLNP